MWRFIADYPERVSTATVVNPGSPYGFGGTKGVEGTPNYPDFAGSGGGVVNPEFARRMGEGDLSAENPQSSPRVVMNNFYFKPPFIPAREEDLVKSVVSEHVGPQEYPGDLVPSANWPNVAPGVYGPANALSPKYLGDVNKFFTINPKPSILWVRGSHDQIVSDNSLFDLGTLGALGAVPGWPGVEIYPPQPMVGQTRTFLEKYAKAGGTYKEVVIEETGHTPFIEKPGEFNEVFLAHIR
jgi:pimeloyl-ACP methyl ester carboxylesterase